MTDAWAGVIIFHGVHEVTDEIVQGWRRQFPSVQFVLITAGFPCQDLSSANPDRQGLAGNRSSLFWVLVRIQISFERFFLGALVLVLGENVQGMPFMDLVTISTTLMLSPYAICSSLFSWVRRPRYWWISRTLAEYTVITIRRGAE